MKSKIHKTIIFTISFIVLLFYRSPELAAQSADAGAPGQFLRQGIGSRALVFGFSYSAIADGPAAVIWNPAGLSQIDQFQISVMHSQLFYDTKYQYGAIVYHRNKPKWDKWHFGLSLISLSMSGLEKRDKWNHLTGHFNYADQAAFFSESYNKLTAKHNISFGLSIIGLWHTIGGVNYKKGGLKLGLLYQPLAWGNLNFLMPFRAGVTITSIFGGKYERYPISFNAGVSRVIQVKRNIRILPAIGLSKVQGSSTSPSWGTEFIFHYKDNDIYLRVGQSNYFNFGAGIRTSFLPLQSLGIQHAQIDFTMQSASKQSSLGTASFMTFSFGFNAPKYALAYKTPDEISKMKKEELIKQLSRYPFDHELTERFGKSARTVEDIYKDEIAFRLESLALANGDTSLAMHYADFAESLFPLDRKYRKIRGNIYSLKNKQYYNKIGPEVSKDMPPLIKDYQKRSRYFRRKKAPALNYLACLLLGEQFGKQKKNVYKGEIKNLLAEKGVIKFSKIIKTLPPKQKNRLLFLKAVAYERIGEYQNAAKQWQALENTTGYATLALYHESVLYLKAGNYKSADEKLKKLNQIKQYSILDREEMGLFPIQSDNSLRDDYWFLKGYSEFLKKGKTAGDSTERRKIVNNYAEILNFNPASNIGKFLNSPLITGNIFQKFLNYVNTANDAVFTRAFNAYFKAFQNGIMTDITFIENYQSKK